MQPCPSHLKVLPLHGEEDDLVDLAQDLFDSAVVISSQRGQSMRHRLINDLQINPEDGSIQIAFDEAALRIAEQPGHEYHDVIRLLLQRSERPAI